MKNRTLAILSILPVLLSCGGGGENQQVKEVRAKVLAFSKEAVVYVSGMDLRSNMHVKTGVCKNPVFSAQSAPELAIINCVVTATGEQPLIIYAADGRVLFSGTMSIPKPEVTMITSMGTIVAELYPEVAPITVTNFLKYVNSSYYTNTLFHRVIPDFVVQGGGYSTGMLPKPGAGEPIPLETNRGLSNLRGSLAMARTENPDSATTEFYFNLVDNPSLDYKNPNGPGYAVFGRVVKGIEVVDAIADTETGPMNGYLDVPTNDVFVKAAFQSR